MLVFAPALTPAPARSRSATHSGVMESKDPVLDGKDEPCQSPLSPTTPGLGSGTIPELPSPSAISAAGASSGGDGGGGGGGGSGDGFALRAKTGDLSKAHLLAERERHFLEQELRVGPSVCLSV